MAFASGKNSWGISDRSGFRYRLRDMKKEWTGALVGKDEFEPKHPQLNPRKHRPDPQALRDPRPDRREPLVVYVGIWTPEKWEDYTLVATAKLGRVEVSTP
jgi:hypothetical protein